VTLTAEVEEAVASVGVWARLHARRPSQPITARPALEDRLERLLDDLGAAHRKPFRRE
jgi:hypothetical protein